MIGKGICLRCDREGLGEGFWMLKPSIGFCEECQRDLEEEFGEEWVSFREEWAWTHSDEELF